MEDAVQAHQRPKLEHYGSIIFVVLRAAHYVDPQEIIDFGEIHLFLGEDFVISVRHGDYPDLKQVRVRLEENPQLLVSLGRQPFSTGSWTRSWTSIARWSSSLERDIDEIEIEVFGGEADVSRRTYSLAREVIDFQRAVTPLRPMLTAISEDKADSPSIRG